MKYSLNRQTMSDKIMFLDPMVSIELILGAKVSYQEGLNPRLLVVGKIAP